MKTRIPPALAFVVLAAAPVSAQDARDLTVDESVRLGLERNARLQAAEADASAATAVLRQARAGRLPTLSAQADYTRLSDNIPNVTFTVPGTDSTVTFQNIELDQVQGELREQQTLFTGSRLGNRVRAAEHEERAADLRAEQERADVAFEIRQAYWELYRARAVRESLAGALERVEAHLSEVQARVGEGTALRRDLLAARTRRSEVELERLEAENAVRVGELELNRRIGMPLDTPVRPASEVEIDTAEASLDTLAAVALAQRPELIAAREDVAGLEAQVRASRGEWWPQVDFVGRYLYARPNPYFFLDQTRFRGSWELGFSTRWPLWEGGRRSARTAELRARLEAARARLTEARLQVSVEVARQQLEVVRARQAVAVAAQNVSEAEESFRVVRAQFAEGVALSSDVLDAEEAYRQAEERSGRSRADYAVARAALLNGLGRVW